MAQVNPLTREVLIKIVYYGPGLGGKTTTLQRVHAASPAETRGKIVSLATPVDRTLYFDFLPLRLPPVQGYPVRLQLFTVPGQVYFNATRKLVLTGADGVVFVADSQRDRLDANIESLQNLRSNLTEQGRDLGDVPHVMQYNKRDLPQLLTVQQLEEALNHHRARSFESSASAGQGVLEPLDELVRLVLADLERREIFREAQPTRGTPSFAPVGEGLGDSISRASEELWTSDDRTSESGPGSRPPRGSRPVPHIVGGSPPVGMRELDPPSARPEAPPSPRAAASARASSMAGSSTPPARGSQPARAPSYAPQASERPAASSGWSFATWFADAQQGSVMQLERDLAAGDTRGAVHRSYSLASELLADIAERGGLDPDERKSSMVALLLGMPGERWLRFRTLVSRARDGDEISYRDALEAFATLVEIERLRKKR